VRPGISGWAQVSQGHVCEIDDVFKKLSYDFFYISRFTFWIDMLIVVRTIKTLLTGFGSR
jgi:lipopolysaccharide/colanic/teichoic acid biosynthesis glycosyltransferase